MAVAPDIKRSRIGLPQAHSVRGRIFVILGVLVLILAVVVGASLLLIRSYRADMKEMQDHDRAAYLLEDARVNAVYAGASLEQYILTGDSTRLSAIQGPALAALRNLEEARDQAADGGDTEEMAALDDALKRAQDSLPAVYGLIQLRETAGSQAAAEALQRTLPELTAFWTALQNAAVWEQEKTASLRSSADKMGDAAVWFLLVSGAGGVAAGFIAFALIGRSIIQPLTSLEATARRVAAGDTTARAATSGPREVVRLAESLNFMMGELTERETRLKRSNKELKDRNRQLLEARAEAATDGLTGLPNHRAFHERVRRYMAGSNDPVLGLIMLDIDGFKQINDSYGHLKGDQILRELATCVGEVVGIENAHRYGGDEFAVILADASTDETAETAERVRKAFEDSPAGRTYGITISLGVACSPANATTADQLIYGADAAMYWAKSAGKNRVGHWEALRQAGSDGGPATMLPTARR